MQLVNRNALTSMLLSILFMVFAGCDQQSPTSKSSAASSNDNDIRIIGINSEEFLFTSTEQGGDITFSATNFDHCRLSFIKNKIKPGYHTRTETFGEGDVDLTCLTDKKLYAMSPISPTFIDMTATELTDKTISIKLNFSLYSARTHESLTKNNLEIIIEGDNLKKLLIVE